LLFAPVGALIPQALQAVAKGGVVVCGGIHMSDIPSFPYAFLWGERRPERFVILASLGNEGAISLHAVDAGMPCERNLQCGGVGWSGIDGRHTPHMSHEDGEARNALPMRAGSCWP
jgi:hypothetical protein